MLNDQIHTYNSENNQQKSHVSFVILSPKTENAGNFPKQGCQVTVANFLRSEMKVNIFRPVQHYMYFVTG